MTGCEEVRTRLLEGNPGATADPHLPGCADCRRFAAAVRAVDLGLSQLASAPLPAVPPAPAVPARVLPLRRSPVRAALAVAVAAAAAAVLIFLRREPARLPLLTAHSEMTSTGQSAALLPGGAQVTLERGALFVDSVAPQRQRLVLRSGAVALQVPRLPAGAHLSVATDEAEVSVRGTRFRVARGAEGTAVAVEEGTVEVQPAGEGRPLLVLRAGENASVPPLEAYRLLAREDALAAIARSDLPATAAHIERLLATRPTGDLEGQARALLAWQRQASGDRAGALVEYRRALAAGPPGARPVWADNAAAELALLLEHGGDPAAAREAWESYLARFPEGTHADQARRHLRRER